MLCLLPDFGCKGNTINLLHIVFACSVSTPILLVWRNRCARAHERAFSAFRYRCTLSINYIDILGTLLCIFSLFSSCFSHYGFGSFFFRQYFRISYFILITLFRCFFPAHECVCARINVVPCRSFSFSHFLIILVCFVLFGYTRVYRALYFVSFPSLTLPPIHLICYIVLTAHRSFVLFFFLHRFHVHSFSAICVLLTSVNVQCVLGVSSGFRSRRCILMLPTHKLNMEVDLPEIRFVFFLLLFLFFSWKKRAIYIEIAYRQWRCKSRLIVSWIALFQRCSIW